MAKQDRAVSPPTGAPNPWRVPGVRTGAARVPRAWSNVPTPCHLKTARCPVATTTSARATFSAHHRAMRARAQAAWLRPHPAPLTPIARCNRSRRVPCAIHCATSELATAQAIATHPARRPRACSTNVARRTACTANGCRATTVTNVSKASCVIPRSPQWTFTAAERPTASRMAISARRGRCVTPRQAICAPRRKMHTVVCKSTAMKGLRVPPTRTVTTKNPPRVASYAVAWLTAIATVALAFKGDAVSASGGCAHPRHHPR
jgi:hypothetical protein